jgi:catechol 2,3-dioxygenase-like lactoylglutathione lyase family enzyme
MPQTSTDPLALIDVDHVRFYVGNAKQAAYFYAHTFGFNITQVADLTTGSRDEADYLLTQGNIRLLLTTPLTKDHPAAEEIKRYGDGVKDIALTVFDAEKATSARSQRRELRRRAAHAQRRQRHRHRRLDQDLRPGHPHLRQPDRRLRAAQGQEGDGGLFMPVFKHIDSPSTTTTRRTPAASSTSTTAWATSKRAR